MGPAKQALALPKLTWFSWRPEEAVTFELEFSYGLVVRMSFSRDRLDPFAWVELRQNCCAQGRICNSQARCPWCHAEPIRVATPWATVGLGPRHPLPDLNSWVACFIREPLEATLVAQETALSCQDFFELCWASGGAANSPEAIVEAAEVAMRSFGAPTWAEEKYPF